MVTPPPPRAPQSLTLETRKSFLLLFCKKEGLFFFVKKKQKLLSV